ncbi:cln5 [Symbiodinium pilosum]|uniref:Cln5 protein n=1 Tax=Symbiodinium pilosum TaxID=2952 RepID=A0A812VGM1_SYMPI|nr:cln5 [Symbiodinium pilosum]
MCTCAFVQSLSWISVGAAPQNWTIEFDSVTNVLGAVLPKIENETLAWNNDARYCVTPGILWGEAHWSKMFDLALQLTSSQAKEIFTQFIPSVNRTAHHNRPLYQLWRVVRRQPEELLVKDITCGDGINWILHFATTKLGVSVTPGFELKFTSILFHADRLNPVEVGGEQWPDVVKYFNGMIHAMESNQTSLERLLDVLHLMPIHFVYDGNAKAYFQVIGNHFPWLSAQYRSANLEGPPWFDNYDKSAVVVV